MLPSIAPVSVPSDQPGIATVAAPKVNTGSSFPSLAIDTPKFSSVIQKPSSILIGVPTLESSFWLRAADISIYLAFAIASIKKTSIYPAPAAISVKPMYSPAEAFIRKLVSVA